MEPEPMPGKAKVKEPVSDVEKAAIADKIKTGQLRLSSGSMSSTDDPLVPASSTVSSITSSVPDVKPRSNWD